MTRSLSLLSGSAFSGFTSEPDGVLCIGFPRYFTGLFRIIRSPFSLVRNSSLLVLLIGLLSGDSVLFRVFRFVFVVSCVCAWLAVSLSAAISSNPPDVVSSKFVAEFAMGLSEETPTSEIFFRRNDFQVVRVAAPCVAAQVIRFKAIGYWTSKDLIGNSMSHLVSAVELGVSISIAIHGSLPIPTPSNSVDFNPVKDELLARNVDYDLVVASHGRKHNTFV